LGTTPCSAHALSGCAESVVGQKLESRCSICRTETNETSSTIPAGGIARDDSSKLWSTAAGLDEIARPVSGWPIRLWGAGLADQKDVPLAVIVALFATAAYAATITGTDKSNVLYESNPDDTIDGKGADDTLRAGDDRFPFDTDNLDGGTGTDTLNAADGDNSDTLDGGAGDEKCTGDPLDTYENCEIIKR
jgi:Ca2+-binding RTX toxin-like protein